MGSNMEFQTVEQMTDWCSVFKKHIRETQQAITCPMYNCTTKGSRTGVCKQWHGATKSSGNGWKNFELYGK